MFNGKERHLTGEEAGKVVLEIIECGCGFHLGIDSSWLDLDESKGEKIECPSCGRDLHVEELTRPPEDEIDEFHLHEALDRCHVICSNIDDHLLSHPVVEQYSHIKDLILNGQSLIAKACQEIDSISIEEKDCGKEFNYRGGLFEQLGKIAKELDKDK
jgi:hypothetical protein